MDVYPNPSSNGKLYLDLLNIESYEIHVQLFNELSELVLERKYLTDDQSTKRLELLSGLQTKSGTYILKVKAGDSFKSFKVILK